MRLIFALIALMICGCATTKPIEPQRLSQIKKIGAVSLLGDKLHTVKVGTTAFNNVNNLEPVPEWNVDAFAVAEFQRYIGTTRSYTFTPVAYKPDELFGVYDSRKGFSYSDFDIDRIKDKLATIRDKYGIDTLLLLLSTRGDATGNGHYIYGYSVFSRSLFGAEVGSRFHLGATIAVIDLRNLEMLSSSPVSVGKSLERGVWKESIDQYSAEEQKLLKSYTLDAISSGISASLEKLGLVK